ncbi:hypothetical protein [Dulcicalothrix desertica]|uniref:hypothetical protein n=1 Tax=Dulcicalothrix desertica TaxID=32056 RepID=UPI00119AF4EA|nr:hypothetical protein [Dulcicalothrix desertica]TWH50482.1 hypothetical protein CAL7102_04803 [Dulcicalothrix desertica PCC 7102]
MESRSIYNINSRQQQQPVQASNSLPANVNSYFNSIVYGAKKVVLSRVRNNGGKYSISGEDNKNNPSKNSGYAKGSGSIYCRTITKNGKDYSQFFYSWKLQGKKRTKYIPKDLVSQVKEAVEQKRTVVEILKLLGDMGNDPSKNPSNDSGSNISPSKNNPNLLGDMENDPSKNPSNDSGGNISPSKNNLDLLGDMKNDPSKNPSNRSGGNISPSKNNLDLLGDIATNPSKNPSNDSGSNISPSKNSLDLLGDMENDPSNDFGGNIFPSKTRRKKGEGSGYVYWRLVKKNRKVYLQAYYHYEVWSEGDRLIKSSKYISKRILPQILKLDEQKAPVSDILTVLRIII